MKIIMCFLCLFFLTSCDTKNISETLFIASIGIEKVEDEYRGYFYLPLSTDIGKSDTEGIGKGEYATVKGKSIAELFTFIKATTSLSVNFKHVSSIVIKAELFSQEFLEELFAYIKYSLEIDYNCYIFITEDDLNELYNFQNPNQESVLNSILVSTSDSKGLFLVTKPMHFLELCSKYYEYRSILVPIVSVEEIWVADESKVNNPYCQSAMYFYRNEKMFVIKDENSPYLNELTDFYVKIKEASVCFEHYKAKLQFKERIIIDIEFKYQAYLNSITNEEVKDFITNNVIKYIDKYQNMDPLDLDYYNKIYNKKYTYQDIEFKFKIDKS